MTPASIGVNLLWLVPGEVGGSEQSTVATLLGLVDRAHRDLDLRLYVLPAFADGYPDLVSAVPTTVADVDGRSRLRRIVAESTWLATAAADVDLLHHAGGTVPWRSPRPAVLTLHDLQPLEARATHGRPKRWYLRWAIPRAVRASRRVAVPSEFVRRTVIDRLGAPADRVVAIPHAVPVRPPATSPDVLVDRYRLDGPVVLYPAVTYPHKDHATLLCAFEALLEREPDALLVLPGGAAGAEEAVRAQIASSPALQARVRRVGRIPEADVAGLLALATVVAVPSRYEGFGLPALEAMAAGTPVLAARAAALPEVLGDAGALVAPGDVAAWTGALADALSDPVEAERRRGAGLARAARYTAQANADGFAELYRDALKEP